MQNASSFHTDPGLAAPRRKRAGRCDKFWVVVLWMAVIGLPTQDGHATSIYRWTDESGRVHISDTVPEQYRASATHYDARAFERTEEQVRRAAANRSRTAEALRPPLAPPRPSPPVVQSPGLTTLAKKPPPLDRETADCDALHREFKQAQECFARYRTRDGVRGQAFQMCRDLPAPPDRCGLQNIYR